MGQYDNRDPKCGVKCRKCGEEKKLDYDLHLFQTSYGATGQESQEGECYDCIEKGYEAARGKEERGEALTVEEEDILEDAEASMDIEAGPGEDKTEQSQPKPEYIQPAEEPAAEVTGDGTGVALEPLEEETANLAKVFGDEKLRTFRIDRDTGADSRESWGADIQALTPKEALDITGWSLADVNIRELTPVAQDKTKDSWHTGGGWRKVKAEEVEGLAEV